MNLDNTHSAWDSIVERQRRGKILSKIELDLIAKKSSRKYNARDTLAKYGQVKCALYMNNKRL